MGSVLVDGKVVGNISVEVVCLRNKAEVYGNITCKSITIDPEVIISGKLNINPQAPKLFDSNGNEVDESAQVVF
jgi:cytoskeletal protein CcmA (bactofilin family)